MKRRIIAGMSVNSFGMAITIVIQILSLPLFLHYWGMSTYGIWLMLSAIPAYFSIADVGMVTAAGNKMTMAMGKGDECEANRVFQSAQMYMGIVCGAIFLLVAPLVAWAPIPGLGSMDCRFALIALVVAVLLSLLGGLTEAVFKSTQRYAMGAMLGNYIRLGEWFGYMIGLAAIGSFTAVALSGLAVRLFMSLAGMVMASKGGHGLKWGLGAADRTEIRVMMKPAVCFMAFPLANAMSFQGVTLLVGIILGPSSVAVLNAYRTIARVAVQVTAIFGHTLWPEFSRLFGQGAMAAIARLFRRAALLGAAQAICISFALYLLSPWLLKIWTHGAIEFVPPLMLLMLLYAAVGGIWHVPRVLLMATNQHIGLAYWSIVAGALSVGLAWMLSTISHLNGVAAAMLLSELFIAIACTWLAYSALAVDLNRKAMPA